jgi:hypothetical protein
MSGSDQYMHIWSRFNVNGPRGQKLVFAYDRAGAIVHFNRGYTTPAPPPLYFPQLRRNWVDDKMCSQAMGEK